MVVMPPAARLKKPAPALPEDKTFELADMFKMLGDPTRLRIVIATLEGPVAVSDIAERLGLSLSLVSHHLRLCARRASLRLTGAANRFSTGYMTSMWRMSLPT